MRRMLGPHMFPQLAAASELSIQHPPPPLLPASPGLVCDVAPPHKFGWQVSNFQTSNYADNLLRMLQAPPAIPQERELVQVRVVSEFWFLRAISLLHFSKRDWYLVGSLQWFSFFILFCRCSCIAVQEWLAQIQQHRDLTPGDDVCTVLDDAAALPSPPPSAWRVTFLGTGGALPSKHRNVSGILLSYKCVPLTPCAVCRTNLKPLSLLVPRRQGNSAQDKQWRLGADQHASHFA
jgi:hypothetical protein